MLSKYSGSGPTQSEAITTRPSSVSTSSEIRPFEWPGVRIQRTPGSISPSSPVSLIVRTMSITLCSIAV